jgi:hypothetical protein
VEFFFIIGKNVLYIIKGPNYLMYIIFVFTVESNLHTIADGTSAAPGANVNGRIMGVARFRELGLRATRPC